jgi:predicted nucleic acid-binding Zn ribbon protein
MTAYHCIACPNELPPDVVADFCSDQCEDEYLAGQESA